MGLFDGDPKFEALKALRESGYDGPIDQDGNKVETGPMAEICGDLRRRGAGAN
jgi:hypothetical protein